MVIECNFEASYLGVLHAPLEGMHEWVSDSSSLDCSNCPSDGWWFFLVTLSCPLDQWLFPVWETSFVTAICIYCASAIDVAVPLKRRRERKRKRHNWVQVVLLLFPFLSIRLWPCCIEKRVRWTGTLTHPESQWLVGTRWPVDQLCCKSHPPVCQDVYGLWMSNSRTGTRKG